jgi:CubicO group peptidase (beta-lactamase class C family)
MASASIDPARFPALDAYLASARDDIGIPGIAVVVVQGDHITHLRTLGVADASGRPITPDTPFQLASTSKAFTALAVMQLVEAGRLELDAPVQRYLPWFSLADPAAAAAITLRQLLNHTSGLSTAIGQTDNDSDDQDAGSLERVVRGLVSVTTIAAPGTEYHYSNMNYDILGLVVQTVSGETFSQYIEGQVFGPLEMHHSHATLDAARADGLAAGYYRWFGLSWQPTDVPRPRASGPSATMFASAEDLGHELIAHLNGGRYGTAQILSAAGIDALHTPGVKIDDFHGYAMGWQVRPLWEALDPTEPGPQAAFTLPALVEHDGIWGTAHSYVGMVPAQGWGFAVLVNAWDFAQPSRFSLIDQNILRILVGKDARSWSATEEPLLQNGRLVAVALLVLEVLSLLWWLLRFRRLARRPATRRLRLVVQEAASLGLDAFVVWLYLIYAPEHFENTFWTIVRQSPDLGLVGLPTLALALFWGPVRTVLLAWFIVRRRPSATNAGIPSRSLGAQSRSRLSR